MEDKKNTQVIDLLVEILELLKKSENSARKEVNEIVIGKKARFIKYVLGRSGVSNDQIDCTDAQTITMQNPEKNETYKKPTKYSKKVLKIASIIVALIATFGGLAEIASLCLQ